MRLRSRTRSRTRVHTRAFDPTRDASIVAHYARSAGGRIAAGDRVRVFESGPGTNAPVGYAVYRVNRPGGNVTLVWLHAIGYGKKAMRLLVAEFKRNGVKRINADVSIDPTERLADVVRRLNFWFGIGFRVVDIKFRPKYGPLLKMTYVI